MTAPNRNQTSVPLYLRTLYMPSYIALVSDLTDYRSVIAKLLGFTFAMITLPIGSYFMAVNTIFKGGQLPGSQADGLSNAEQVTGNSTYAGALAALMANVVLIGYIVVAFQDDQSERLADEAEKKKSL